MIIHERLNQWLNHRFGTKILQEGFDNYITKSLENNNTSKSLIETYGNKEISSYVGFIDLKGYSKFCNGKTSLEIRDFSKSFLNEIINILVKKECLIDKTIGDEVMFILPHKEESQMHTHAKLGQIIGGLIEYSYKNESEYKFRVGISYGKLCLDKIGDDNYSEWAVFGEPIITAKRLMSLDEIQDANPIAIVLGKNDNSERCSLPELEEVYKSSCWIHNNCKQIEKLKKEFKGEIKVTYTYFLPLRENLI
ncbi:MAG: hypothetical protein CVV22_02555 [Ignavibacteriae bacterium HGW-Ignavibacteriae-1]|jgi:hypothetical protein|nr:MAG: hypothetical protein CVV22_02555 [Ignavibacteriae bacterium HGW-Ignavibacteriae-1]